MPRKSFEELLRQAHVVSNQPLSQWWRLHGSRRQTAGAAALTRRATQNSDGSLFAHKV